ncbi:MAG: transcription antitermination factor NusB [Proteobacteria bacterium]|nr:transcription antitermination factor NusB [Pseudomonadota bacterium]
MTTQEIKKENKPQKAINSPRHSSRIAAIQALYQIEQNNDSVKSVLRQMVENDFLPLQQEGYISPDVILFEELVTNTFNLQPELDETISSFLSDNWRLERLATIVKIILRLAIYELKNSLTIPDRVIINEYIEATKAFFDKSSESSFVNGILDKIAQKIRSA